MDAAKKKELDQRQAQAEQQYRAQCCNGAIQDILALHHCEQQVQEIRINGTLVQMNINVVALPIPDAVEEPKTPEVGEPASPAVVAEPAKA